MFNSLGAVLLHVEMCLAASLAETLWYSASSGLICMIQSARCCGGGRLPFIRHSHLMGYSTHFCWVGNFVLHGKKTRIHFCYLCNTQLKLRDIIWKMYICRLLTLKITSFLPVFFFAPKPACKETKVFSSQTGTAWHGATHSVSVLPPPHPFIRS